jgi:hypothetical protein
MIARRHRPKSSTKDTLETFLYESKSFLRPAVHAFT